MRDPLVRARKRPSPDLWRDDEPMTLAEVEAVFFPEGPLTLSSLRTAIRHRRLAVAQPAGKMITTPKDVREMLRTNRDERSRQDPGGPAPAASPSRSLSLAAGRSAQAAGKKMITEMREHSRSLSRDSTRVLPVTGL